MKKEIVSYDDLFSKRRRIYIHHQRYDSVSGRMTIKVMSKREADRIISVLGWYTFDTNDVWSSVVYDEYSHRVIKYYGIGFLED